MGVTDFQIDGKDMPRPSSWQTKRNITTKDAGRNIGTGAMMMAYLTTVLETTWTYKYIREDKYRILYDAYILETVRSKNMFHSLTTLDSNSGQRITYEIYTQNDFNGPLHIIKDGVKYYKDVVFTFVGKGGVE